MNNTQDFDIPVDETAAIELSAEQHSYIAGLREMADFFEKNPEMCSGSSYTAYRWFGAQDIAATAKALGKVKKATDETDFRLERQFGPHTLVCFTSHKGLCKKVVTGTKTVTEKVVDPAYIAPPKVDVPMVEITREVEVFEWVCPESILKPKVEALV